MNILSRAWPRLSSQQEKQPALGFHSQISLHSSAFTCPPLLSPFLSFSTFAMPHLRPFSFVRHRDRLCYLFRYLRVTASFMSSSSLFTVYQLTLANSVSLSRIVSLPSALRIIAVSFVPPLSYFSIFLVPFSLSHRFTPLRSPSIPSFLLVYLLSPSSFPST